MSLSVIFSKNNGLISRIVCFFTRSDWSHVDIYDPDTDTVIGAEAGIGVREKTLDELLMSSSKNMMVTFENLNSKKPLAYARSKLGAGYDWMACIGFVTKAMLENPQKYFCSELISKAFAYGGYPIVLDERHIKVSPDLIYCLAGFGKLKINREMLT